MSYQSVFKRYEIKFMLTNEQKDLIVKAMSPYMLLDDYGRTTIRNIYFDTDSYLLIRRSIEKPLFKEKLRIRSYKKVNDDDAVFVEIKKKYKGVVYKRRLALPEKDAMTWIENGKYPLDTCQISKEIDYFIEYYKTLKPAVFLSYEREAYYDINGSDFRVTFDRNVLSRTSELSLREEAWGDPLLADNMVLMELKTSGGIPLWMAHLLTEMKIFKTSFSKYGNAYLKISSCQKQGGFVYA